MPSGGCLPVYRGSAVKFDESDGCLELLTNLRLVANGLFMKGMAAPGHANTDSRLK